MPLPIPNLDDRTFEDLVAEALTLIPGVAPDWTDHNPSDPGITVLEMFAYLTETLIYRVNRISDDHMRAFLTLLNGPGWTPAPGVSLRDQVRTRTVELRRPDRAVSAEDYERLALESDPRDPKQVRRAHCVPRRDLTVLATGPPVEAPGHVTVVIVADPSIPNDDPSAPGAELAGLLTMVFNYLSDRRLLTTRLHVVPSRVVTIGLALTIQMRDDADEQRLGDAVITDLTTFYHPLTGGADGGGWPFGRPIYVSELYRHIEAIPGVDFVTKTAPGDEVVLISPDTLPSRLANDAAGNLLEVRLGQEELVKLDLKSVVLTMVAANGTATLRRGDQ
jgi:hypothetical protein